MAKVGGSGACAVLVDEPAAHGVSFDPLAWPMRNTMPAWLPGLVSTHARISEPHTAPSGGPVRSDADDFDEVVESCEICRVSGVQGELFGARSCGDE